MALSNEAMVFSGKVAEAPRWPLWYTMEAEMSVDLYETEIEVDVSPPTHQHSGIAGLRPSIFRVFVMGRMAAVEQR